MRNILLGLLILTLGAFVSCSKDDSDDVISDSSAIENSGLWKISKYSENGQNLTSYFTGYTFEFLSGEALIAKKGTMVINGSWKIIKDSNRTKLVIKFPKTDKFDEISEDWELTQQTDKIISLTHLSGGNGSVDVDLLEFSR